MSQTNVDLNKLNEEIARRKSSKGTTNVNENANYGAPKDAFLNGLVKSLMTGQQTPALDKIRKVDSDADRLKVNVNGTVEVKKNAPAPVRTTQPTQPAQQYTPQPERLVEMSPERDDQIFAEFERRSKQKLTEEMAKYANPQQPMQPMQPVQQPMQGMPMINEAYLAESVNKMVKNYLVENFGPVLEEAIKDTILEMYAVERIKEVLNENKEMIKTIVYETIKEIRSQQKK